MRSTPRYAAPRPPVAVAPSLLWLREFPGRQDQAAQARRWMAGFLPPCEPLDSLLLVASEMAANAIEHTRSGRPGGRFSVDVAWSPGLVRVVVADQGSGKNPAVVDGASACDPLDEHGRGLLLVQQMSAAWGIAGDERRRWVWADLRWGPDGGPGLVDSAGGVAPSLVVACLRRDYPGTTVWYGSQNAAWWAVTPGTAAGDNGDGSGSGDDLICAPSLAALAQMLTRRHRDYAGTGHRPRP